jgi:uncharacterized protein
MSRIISIIIICSALSSGFSCGQTKHNNMTASDNTHPYTNELAKETSPYLLQHSHNPVNWYPWGDKALKQAGQDNKLLIISIGYAACHWCHVMEHESFEDTSVARLMNDNYVSIKVDREERPDVDQIYMNAVHLISGQGGWPLNALALPDGRPFYAGTYFRNADWIKVLRYFSDLYEKTPEVLIEQAEKVTQGIRSLDLVAMNQEASEFSIAELDKVFDLLHSNLDHKKGGIKRSPKFPMPSVWEFLLHYHNINNNPEVLESVKITLDNMAWGGIYDHLGGGFARYSTDGDWHVPHFEKMLYDNAQLVSLYSHAWQLTKNPLYKRVVYETLEFIEREMTSSEGGFYSSLDADSEGEEGKFYVWTAGEVEAKLGNHAKLFMDYYNISKEGNWEEGKNILFRNQSEQNIAVKLGITEDKLRERISEDKIVLMNARNMRTRPGLDDKILTSWNALMLTGYVHAYRAFGEKKFLTSAIRNADFLLQNTYNSMTGISRNYKEGKSTIPGFLDDYAFTIAAYIELYQATLDEKWLERANDISAYTIDNFFDDKSGMFFYTHGDHASLIARNMEIADNVIPSSNSEMAKNLFKLGNYFYNDDYMARARQMVLNVSENAHQNIFYYSNWGILEAQFANSPHEVAILGKSSGSIRESLDEHYLPFILISGGTDAGSLKLLQNKMVPGQTTIYVCKDKVCKLPVTNVSEALVQLKH